jgi:hypothetical protein
MAYRSSQASKRELIMKSFGLTEIIGESFNNAAINH